MLDDPTEPLLRWITCLALIGVAATGVANAEPFHYRLDTTATAPPTLFWISLPTTLYTPIDDAQDLCELVRGGIVAKEQTRVLRAFPGTGHPVSQVHDVYECAESTCTPANHCFQIAPGEGYGVQFDVHATVDFTVYGEDGVVPLHLTEVAPESYLISLPFTGVCGEDPLVACDSNDDCATFCRSAPLDSARTLFQNLNEKLAPCETRLITNYLKTVDLFQVYSHGMMNFDLLPGVGYSVQVEGDCDDAAYVPSHDVCIQPPGPEDAFDPAQPRGMIGWWPFDEVDGPTAAEIVHGMDGTHHGGAIPDDSGRIDRAIGLFGAGDFVEITDDDRLDFAAGEDLSIDAWIQADDVGGIRVIADKRREASEGCVQGYVMYLTPQGRLGFQLADGDGDTNYCGSGANRCCENFSSTVTGLDDGEWHHVAITVDRDLSPDGIKFYVDGQPAGTANPTRQQGSLENAFPLRIGRRSDSPSPGSYHGLLDELEVFDRVLTPDEVLVLAESPPPGKCKCLEPMAESGGWWPFDELTVSSAADLAGFNNDGIWQGVHPIPGKVASALRFDGVVSRVLVPTHAELDCGEDSLTFAAWVRPGGMTQGRRLLLSKREVPGPGYEFYLFDGRPGVWLRSDTAVEASHEALTGIGAGWHHLAVVVERSPDSSVVVRYYVDGRQIETWDAVLFGSLDNLGNLHVGAGEAPQDRFDGDLDEVHLLCRALWPGEIEALYLTGLRGECKPECGFTDTDGDGVGDECDNCPLTENAEQRDLDQDLNGDACDLDIDGDGFGNGVDRCPETHDPDQTDSDDDQVGDACDVCPLDPDDQQDNDGDGVGDACDNCRGDFNPLQERIAFPFTLYAIDRDHFGWAEPRDVMIYQGPLFILPSNNGIGSHLLGVDQIEISEDPPPGLGTFVIVGNQGACGSWETALDEQPWRDELIPIWP